MARSRSAKETWTCAINAYLFLLLTRITQMLAGVVTLSLALTTVAKVPYDWAMICIAVLSTFYTITACVGIFANQRPHDVHWHLMLTLDWCSLIAATASAALVFVEPSDLNAWGKWGYNPVAHTVVMVLTLIAMVAFVVPVARTHRLQRRRALPPANMGALATEDSYAMDKFAAPSSTYQKD